MARTVRCGPLRCPRRCSHRCPAASAWLRPSRLFAPRLESPPHLIVTDRAASPRIRQTPLDHRGEGELLDDLFEGAVVRLLVDDASQLILRRGRCAHAQIVAPQAIDADGGARRVTRVAAPARGRRVRTSHTGGVGVALAADGGTQKTSPERSCHRTPIQCVCRTPVGALRPSIRSGWMAD